MGVRSFGSPFFVWAGVTSPYLFAVYIRYMYGGNAVEMRALLSIDACGVLKKKCDVKRASKHILRAERIY